MKTNEEFIKYQSEKRVFRKNQPKPIVIHILDEGEIKRALKTKPKLTTPEPNKIKKA